MSRAPINYDWTHEIEGYLPPPRFGNAFGIRMVAIDLDGTLLNDSKTVSDQTAIALRSLPERGIKVVIASARPPRSVRGFHSMLGLDTLTIDRKSTRLNSSHGYISYAVFCLKKNK